MRTTPPNERAPVTRHHAAPLGAGPQFGRAIPAPPRLSAAVHER